MILLRPDLPAPRPEPEPHVFIAGGISGCPRWQDGAIRMLHRTDGALRAAGHELVVASPRRPGDLVRTGPEASAQIEWEHEHLARAALTLFWFCAETVQPITLLELGMQMAAERAVVVGTHPGYERAFDVVERVRLMRPLLVVHHDLTSTVNELHSRVLASAV